MIALTFFFYFVLITGNYSSKIVLTWDWNGCYIYPGVYPINLLFAPVKKVFLLAKSEVDWNNASESNLPDVPHYARQMNQSSWKAQWKINLDIDQDITYAIGFKQQNDIFAGHTVVSPPPTRIDPKPVSIVFPGSETTENHTPPARKRLRSD
ncbi:hypothetical protein Ddc_16906 [Ditylenchus destructor]|nr:hypothetical protein Ddc_16906 [Ditylenchus destructor]